MRPDFDAQTMYDELVKPKCLEFIDSDSSDEDLVVKAPVVE